MYYLLPPSHNQSHKFPFKILKIVLKFQKFWPHREKIGDIKQYYITRREKSKKSKKLAREVYFLATRLLFYFFLLFPKEKFYFLKLFFYFFCLRVNSFQGSGKPENLGSSNSEKFSQVFQNTIFCRYDYNMIIV